MIFTQIHAGIRLCLSGAAYLVQYYLPMRRSIRRELFINLVGLGVSLHGAFIVASTLLEQISLRRSTHVSAFAVNIPLLIGLSLMYLGSRLRRSKHSAWLVAVAGYGFLLVLTIFENAEDIGLHTLPNLTFVRGILLPIIILGLLLYFRQDYTVRSDTQGFRSAAWFALVILVVAFVYGVAGFELLDKRDFRQEISLPSAMHYTIDQFDLTTIHPIHPYTRRAHVFVDSLSVVSVAAVGYAVIAFFQPLRARFADQTGNRQHMEQLLASHPALSEDFFKLWPHDKQYFFNRDGTAGLAFHVYRGVALCLGDPAGKVKDFSDVLKQFEELCYRNDWLPAHIHTGESHRRLYGQHGYTLQKIGQEAVLDLEYFRSQVAHNKQFRHIRNKFTKQGFTSELLKPPHHPAVLERLHGISQDWLSEGGRVERRFAMGYYTPEYMELCDIMVVRDAAGTIQAFLNQVPASFDRQEATFDMFRHTKSSVSNINDFLLLSFADYVAEQGYRRLNLGLCPLVGLEEKNADGSTLIEGFLRFAYANGDRFYSFSGLQRFKSKYEPQWRDRYVAYQGGVRGFSRTMTALMRTLRVR